MRTRLILRLLTVGLHGGGHRLLHVAGDDPHGDLSRRHLFELVDLGDLFRAGPGKISHGDL
jgi:hypothetical protein